MEWSGRAWAGTAQLLPERLIWEEMSRSMRIQIDASPNQFSKGMARLKSVCACPTHPVRAQIPAVLKRNYKTAGIAPLLIQV